MSKEFYGNDDPDFAEVATPDEQFESWLMELTETVIQDEFGYEPGEFAVYPDHWRSLFDEGLTPRNAWQRALDGFREHREEEDQLKAENWRRIQEVDAAYIAAPDAEKGK